MRIFVYEYTCAAAYSASLPASLRAEGRAMLAAVLADFESVPGVQTCTLLADDFAGELPQTAHRTGGDERSAFLRLAQRTNYTLVIAPEFDEILETHCRWIVEAGGKSLNASLEAIRLTADKHTLSDYLRALDIATPPAYPFGVRELHSRSENAGLPRSTRAALC
jgi:predicted ATP-grasp superfamily ATP-dependent carboligase